MPHFEKQEHKVVYKGFSNLQDMFIITLSLSGTNFGLILKTRWPPWEFFSMQWTLKVPIDISLIIGPRGFACKASL